MASRADGKRPKSYGQLESIHTSSKALPSFIQRVFPTGFKSELKHLMVLAGPVILTNILQIIIPIESLIMCGHLSQLEMDGVALANSMINAFGIAINVGLCTACDTLFSQSIGSKNKKRTGIFLQQSIMIICLCELIIGSFHLMAEPLFILLGQLPDVSELAARYMRLFLPGLLFHANYMILARYMQNQDYVYPPLIFGVIGNVFNVATQYVLIYVYGYKTEASAVCQCLTYFIMWLCELIYILVSKMYQRTWDGWSAESLFEWWHFLGLAIPGVGHVAVDEILWEVTVFIGGILGPVELGAQSILFQTVAFEFMMSLGVGVALNIRVGQYLGGNNPGAARASMHVGFVIIMFTSITSSAVVLSCSQYLPYIFTNDPEIVAMTSSIYPYIALVFIADNLLGVCCGVLRGCGRQKLGLLFVIFGYSIGYPFSIILVFVANMKLAGLWVGLILGLTLTTILNVIFLLRQDWNEQARQAQIRVTKSDTTMELEESSESTPLLSEAKDPSHIRTPSNPYTCSTARVIMPVERSNISKDDIVKMALQRVVAFVLLLLLFGTAIFVNLFLPREWYVPQSNVVHNMTTFAPNTTMMTQL